ncbi:hypothetical protein CIB84_006086 [Bambusicola thoracicus]|uniref:Uncharacterized protein n=1 Tax=Bambusicola thoracicus TaxID=9083 RepID=A0A2P4T1C3_BAMTH|nr:hypothetical protein CIB84_006086 [Bambusicola thoracicus]
MKMQIALYQGCSTAAMIHHHFFICFFLLQVRSQ